MEETQDANGSGSGRCVFRPLRPGRGASMQRGSFWRAPGFAAQFSVRVLRVFTEGSYPTALPFLVRLAEGRKIAHHVS